MKKAERLQLKQYLDDIAAATSTTDLERASPDYWLGTRSWDKICDARIAAGIAIADKSPYGRLVPRQLPYRKVSLCGEIISLGSPGNAAGWRWVWCGVEKWAQAIFEREGVSEQLARTIWSWWRSYPHRALAAIEEAYIVAEE